MVYFSTQLGCEWDGNGGRGTPGDRQRDWKTHSFFSNRVPVAWSPGNPGCEGGGEGVQGDVRLGQKLAKGSHCNQSVHQEELIGCHEAEFFQERGRLKGLWL